MEDWDEYRSGVPQSLASWVFGRAGRLGMRVARTVAGDSDDDVL
jgi:hypothetical protein